LTLGCRLPVSLLVIVRLAPLAGRNAVQFLVPSRLRSPPAWAAALCLVPAARPTGMVDIVIGAMVIGSAVLVYLKIWGLLSRGYTPALIVTIHQSGSPLTAAELEAAGLIQRTGDRLVLTPRLGRAAACSYRVAIVVADSRLDSRVASSDRP
jgi:hypothetical protein